ncbi:unnamed protein product [Symbiodinium sp. KB8]|nr:unnamed protein product [Symbiodinium sp. KB8]
MAPKTKLQAIAKAAVDAVDDEENRGRTKVRAPKATPSRANKTPEPVEPKAKPGRPKKTPEPVEPKAKPGRPKKTPAEPVEPEDKPSRGKTPAVEPKEAKPSRGKTPAVEPKEAKPSRRKTPAEPVEPKEAKPSRGKTAAEPVEPKQAKPSRGKTAAEPVEPEEQHPILEYDNIEEIMKVFALSETEAVQALTDVVGPPPKDFVLPSARGKGPSAAAVKDEAEPKKRRMSHKAPLNLAPGTLRKEHKFESEELAAEAEPAEKPKLKRGSCATLMAGAEQIEGQNKHSASNVGSDSGSEIDRLRREVVRLTVSNQQLQMKAKREQGATAPAEPEEEEDASEAEAKDLPDDATQVYEKEDEEMTDDEEMMEGHDEGREEEDYQGEEGEEEQPDDDEEMRDVEDQASEAGDADDDEDMEEEEARDSEGENEFDADSVHKTQEEAKTKDKKKGEEAAGVGEMPAEEPAEVVERPPTTTVEVINTGTHKMEWNRLERFVSGPRGMNMTASDKKKELLKISEMVKRGYSAGVPDEDVPDMVSENYYWVTTERVCSEREESSTTGTFRARTAATPGVLAALAGHEAPGALPAVPLAPGVSNDLLSHIQSSVNIKKELKACNVYVDLPAKHGLRKQLETMTNDLTAILDELRDCSDMPSLEKLKQEAAELVDDAKYTRVQAAAVARELKKSEAGSGFSEDRLQDELDNELLDAVGSGDLTVTALIDYGYLDMLVDYDQLDSFWEDFLKDYPLHPVAVEREACWKCMATKGNIAGADLGFCYTNLKPNAKWMSSYGLSEPYDVRPEFLGLPGFEMDMVWPDILHMFHLGTGRDLVASAVKVLLHTGIFNGRTVALRLRDASLRLLEFSKAHGYTLSIRRLTRKNLGFERKGFPEMMCKGYDTFIILRWLVSEVTHRPPRNQELLCTCLWAADSCLSVASAAGRCMTEAEYVHVSTIGNLFLKSYLRLARTALDARKKIWKVRPKFHMLYHLFCDVSASHANFNYHATWMDEDYNKHVVRIKKSTHKKTATVSTLKRWILGLPGQLETACAKVR